ncbi:translocase [uncultured Gimesia sp.]|uniref:preprotein translocase subunit SecA n=1 Tax=uncultured Gimesia sp. TaxID=1678688 RepID=UPI0030DC5305
MSIASHSYHWMKTGFRPKQSRLSRWSATADQIIQRCESLKKVTDDRLERYSLELRWRAKSGEPLKKILPEAYALVRESAWRTKNMEHFPVQLMGGIALFEGGIAEMQTGEGKTLTAVLPAYLRALMGKGCYVITVNDYLAQRDSEIMGPIFNKLGLSVGCITSDMEDEDRRIAYGLDVTYGTANEMGFDFLRDRIRVGASAPGQLEQAMTNHKSSGKEPLVQRGTYFALIDEADSVLIDEARTPLIIGLIQPNDAASVNLFRWSNRATHQLELEDDFVYEPKKRSAYLTDQGCRKILLMAKPSLLDSIDTERIYKQVEQSLVARFGFLKDRDYVVVDDEVVIVDESTGRMMDGRKWQDGLHQSIEAQEHVPITAATGQAARITVQSFFQNFSHLAGMTGTAALAEKEIRKTYKVSVTTIPTHRPCIREGSKPRIFKTMQDKRMAVVDEIERIREKRCPILVGTPSVEASESLGDLLAMKAIPHQILNAKYHAQEAEIVKKAGEPARVTIATNMAGRGTDIILTDEIRESGGLHVIATEMHTSARIDRQLLGRSARQGDPGHYQFFLSLEDELLRCLELHHIEKIIKSAKADEIGELPGSWISFFNNTQNFLEKLHHKQRRDMLKHEKHRIEMFHKMGLDPYLEWTD